jgi:hypothetical protein
MTSFERAKMIWEALCVAFGGASQIDNVTVIKAVYGQVNNNNLFQGEVENVLGHIAALDGEHFEFRPEEVSENTKRLIREFYEYCQFEADRLATEATEF